jgi:hypothetical protein
LIAAERPIHRRRNSALPRARGRAFLTGGRPRHLGAQSPRAVSLTAGGRTRRHGGVGGNGHLGHLAPGKAIQPGVVHYACGMTADGLSTGDAQGHPRLTSRRRVAKLGDGAWLRQRRSRPCVRRSPSRPAVAATLAQQEDAMLAACPTARSTARPRTVHPSQSTPGHQADDRAGWEAITARRETPRARGLGRAPGACTK